MAKPDRSRPGGFYSYAVLENIFGANIRNANEILPTLSPLKAGSRLWYTPRDAFGGTGFSEIVRIEPERSIILIGHLGGDLRPNGTWSFFLEPVGERETRFIARGRGGNPGQPMLQRLFERFVMVPMHFVMERRMLLGIKERAEAATFSSVHDLIEVILWFVTLVLTLVTAVGAVVALRGSLWLVLFFVSASALLVLPLLRPPRALAIAWTLGAAVGVAMAL